MPGLAYFTTHKFESHQINFLSIHEDTPKIVDYTKDNYDDTDDEEKVEFLFSVPKRQRRMIKNNNKCVVDMNNTNKRRRLDDSWRNLLAFPRTANDDDELKNGTQFNVENIKNDQLIYIKNVYPFWKI